MSQTHIRLGALCALATLGTVLGGCSAKDPVDKTPYYHVGTPTNRGSVNSWELSVGSVPVQPADSRGAHVPIAVIASQRGFEPNDPLAQSVYSALGRGHVDTRYIMVGAKDGVVMISGSAVNQQQVADAMRVASHVEGVKKVRCELTVAK